MSSLAEKVTWTLAGRYTRATPLQLGGTDRWRHMTPWSLHTCPTCWPDPVAWRWRDVYRAPEGAVCEECGTKMIPDVPEPARANDPT